MDANRLLLLTLGGAVLLAVTTTTLADSRHDPDRVKGNPGFVPPRHYHTPRQSTYQFTEIFLPGGRRAALINIKGFEVGKSASFR